MAMSTARKTLIWTAVGASLAGLTIVVAIFFPDGESSGDNPQTQSGGDNQQAGGSGVNVRGDGNVIQQFKDDVVDRSREEAEKIAERFATTPPTQGEPAPFVVVGAPAHLWVRSSGTLAGKRVGAVYNQSTVWADCQAATGWDPEKTDDEGDTWLRIRWHTDKPNEAIGNSDPSGTHPGWVYAGFTLPAGHNGKIPEC